MAHATSCKINIGDYAFKSCINVSINSSRTTLGDTCEIELPMSGVVKNDQRRSVSLDKYFKEGQKVRVALGFDGFNNQRFVGYVKSIAVEDSVVLTCEDEIYSLKRAKPINGTFQNTSLKNLLKAFKSDVQLLKSVPDLQIEEFFCENATPAEALQQIKDTYHLDVYFRNEKLFAGVAYTDYAPAATRYLLWSDPVTKEICNIQKNNLKYLTAATVKYRVKVVSMLPDNTKIEVEVGDKNGELRTEYYYNITDEDALRALGLAQLKRYKQEGYKGTVVAWGLPAVQHSQAIQCVDPLFIGQKGTYIIDSVRDDFGDNGWDLTVGITQKVSS